MTIFTACPFSGHPNASTSSGSITVAFPIVPFNAWCDVDIDCAVQQQLNLVLNPDPILGPLTLLVNTSNWLSLDR